MREINNNKSNLNFPKVEIKKDIPQSAEVKPAEESVQQIPVTEDLSLSPEAVIGRSQVQMAGVNKAAIEADMKTLAQNPQAIQKATDFFDIAYNQLKKNGSENAYEKAAVLTSTFKEEFLD